MDTQYVIFRLGEELYGAAIHDVQEIILPSSQRECPTIRIL